jgi:hypothetical protein
MHLLLYFYVQTFTIPMAIIKSTGFSRTEKLLGEICDKTFLKLWSYPNLYKADGKEVCDVLSVFKDDVFLFFDRESRKFDNPEQDLQLQWTRWKKEVIDKQLHTAEGARKYILEGGKLFLDKNQQLPFPVTMPASPVIHIIIVAHGAKEACKNASTYNISGSLGMIYHSRLETETLPQEPFTLQLPTQNPVHVFDSHNLEIILNELDTVYDFAAYLKSKEEAIRQLDFLGYCGEEDLLAHYFTNYDESTNAYSVNLVKQEANGLFIQEGEWESFITSKPYQARKEANVKYRFWDDMLQRTAQNALEGTVGGNGNVFDYQSAINEMAMEPRFFRRELSSFMLQSIVNFPEHFTDMARNLSFMPSFYPDKGYVFLQVKPPDTVTFENDYRNKRQALLEIACGAAKNKYTHLTKVIGIGIDAPKYSKQMAEDFILLDCKDWSEKERREYEQLNETWKFFQTSAMTQYFQTPTDFPRASRPSVKPPKIGRNGPCFCGSGTKYKKCCGK